MIDNSAPTAHYLGRDDVLADLYEEARTRKDQIDDDFTAGFELLAKYNNTVTVFGSARTPQADYWYARARELGRILADEGYTVITGGGGGIMEAASRGAYEAGGNVLGFNILLPMEQRLNPYTTESLTFSHFFSRKVLMTFGANGFIFFPGGAGTLDEFFEIVTLVQTRRATKAPIICVGQDFWRPMDDMMRHTLLARFRTISPEDADLYTITDDLDLVADILDKHRQAEIEAAFADDPQLTPTV